MSDPREDADNLIVRTREAHEVLKEMKETERRINAAIKLAEDTKLRLIAEVATAVDGLIETAVEVGLEHYMSSITNSISEAEASVRQRFDVLFATLLQDMNDQLQRAIQSRKPGPGGDALQQIRETIQQKIMEVDL